MKKINNAQFSFVFLGTQMPVLTSRVVGDLILKKKPTTVRKTHLLP